MGGKSLAEIPASALTVLLVEDRQLDDLTSFWAVSQLGKKRFTPDEDVCDAASIFVWERTQLLQENPLSFPPTDTNAGLACLGLE